MNKFHTILPAATLAVIAVGAVTAPKASAQEVELQRAEVVAALQAARASGEHDMYHGEDGGSFRLSRQPMPMPASRAQVADALRVSHNRGDYNVLHGEDSGSFWLSATPARQRTAPSLFAHKVAD